MCNLYNLTTTVEALRALFATTRGDGPNLPPSLDFYPNDSAPVIRTEAGGRAIASMKWGYPPPDGSSRWVTNVRNLDSPFWRASLADPARRCLVPFTTFSEWTAAPDPATRRKRKVWFAVDDQPLAAFAGVWRPTGEDEPPRFAFLTTMANSVVAAVHPKAMPVVLQPSDHEAWLTADLGVARSLARAYPDAMTRVVG